MLVTALLIGFVLVATYTDVRWHRVYNWTTYPGILLALGINALGDALLRYGAIDENRLLDVGCLGFRASGYGLLLCGGLMVLCFVLTPRIGGGDVKLIAMLGAFMGPYEGLEAVVWTFLIGACAGLIIVVWRLGPWNLAVRLVLQVLWWFRLGKSNPFDPEVRAQLKPPLYLAPSALAAAVMVRLGLFEYLK